MRLIEERACSYEDVRRDNKAAKNIFFLHHLPCASYTLPILGRIKPLVVSSQHMVEYVHDWKSQKEKARVIDIFKRLTDLKRNSTFRRARSQSA